MDLLNEFQKNWQIKKFANPGQKILLAVSGGMDSMVMADLFYKCHIPIAIGHCNFQLRDQDADLDEALVKDWCLDKEITFHSTRFDTKESAAEWKKGTQETARILRYEWLDAICAEHKYTHIATAHHANDNVETLLINLFKGTGMSGLHGIPEQNGSIIRPVLFAAKADIIEYCSTNKISYRDDVSNATDAYLRNAVRHNIIPVVQQLFPNAIQNVSESIERFTEAEKLYKKAIEQERKKLFEQRGQDIYIPVLKLKHKQPLETICYELFSPYGFTSGQIPHIIELLESGSGHFMKSNTHRVIQDRGFLIITAIAETNTDFISIEGVPCTIAAGRYHFSFSTINTPETISSDSNIAYIDMKRLEFPLTLRKWRLGDYFYPLGMDMKKKKLSRFLIDNKIALHDKEHIWVLECSKRIAWVAGMRLDERFKIKAGTELVLKVEVKMH